MKKIISALTVSVALYFASIPAFAADIQHTNQYLLEKRQTTTLNSPTVEPQGIKGKVVSFAVRQIAKAIRYGGKELNYIMRFLDKEQASNFSKYAYQIADRLDYISNIPDLTAQMVKEYMFNFLYKDLKFDYGTAMLIADAIKGAINWIIF